MRKPIKIRFGIHPLFLMFVCIFIYMGYFWLLLAYVITIMLHESAHALVAYKLGYKLNHFNLMPHGIALSGENRYFSTRDEVLIAIAGPLLNVILAVIGTALWWVFPATYVYTEYFVWANAVTAVINCLPIYPLDGGRVTMAVLTKRFSRMAAQKIMKVVGITLSVLLIVAFVITTFFAVNFTILILGSFLLVTTVLDDNKSYYTRMSLFDNKLQKLSKGGVEVREIAVHESTCLYKLVSQVTPHALTSFTVLGNDMKIKGRITEQQLEKLIEIYPASATLQMILA